MDHANCPKPGSGYKVKVTFAVEIAGSSLAVADTRETVVDGKLESLVEIPKSACAHEIKLMPDRVCQPMVLVIRPTKIGDGELKKPEDFAGLKLEYGTIRGEEHNQRRDRKPICGTHVFANGMAEWVTDMTRDGGPGPLTSLFFWNKSELPDYERDGDGNLKKDKDGKPIQKKDDHGCPKFVPAPVTLSIFIGYSTRAQ